MSVIPATKSGIPKGRIIKMEPVRVTSKKTEAVFVQPNRFAIHPPVMHTSKARME
jgi:hypothetical protein